MSWLLIAFSSLSSSLLSFHTPMRGGRAAGAVRESLAKMLGEGRKERTGCHYFLRPFLIALR